MENIISEKQNLTARAAIYINAPLSSVWDSFVNPEIIKDYMFGTEVISDWLEGSEIIWRGEWQGKHYEDHGSIIKLEKEKAFAYSHFSPLTGEEDIPENYHNVFVEFSGDGTHTIVYLAQDNNKSDTEKEHSESNWKYMLNSLKTLMENKHPVINNIPKTEFTAEPGGQEIIISRIFNAPKELVFAVTTDPEQIPNWWGPKILTTTVEIMDVKPGGMWRILQKEPNGAEHKFHGIFHSVVENERIVRTFEYEGVQGHVVLDEIIYEDFEGKTLYRQHSVFQSIADRDGMVNASAESGLRESMNRLEEILAIELEKS